VVEAISARVARVKDADVVTLLALDWTGQQEELIVGRQLDCDVVLTDPSVSRQHARLVFRGSRWIIQDLESTNGTILNGNRIGRSELHPGDRLALGLQRLRVD
jgi:pSer/pThr/pTyr-binding forkhead associated (FHA) protein